MVTCLPPYPLAPDGHGQDRQVQAAPPWRPLLLALALTSCGSVPGGDQARALVAEALEGPSALVFALCPPAPPAHDSFTGLAEPALREVSRRGGRVRFAVEAAPRAPDVDGTETVVAVSCTGEVEATFARVAGPGWRLGQLRVVAGRRPGAEWSSGSSIPEANAEYEVLVGLDAHGRAALASLCPGLAPLGLRQGTARTVRRSGDRVTLAVAGWPELAAGATAPAPCEGEIEAEFERTGEQWFIAQLTPRRPAGPAVRFTTRR